MMSLALCVAFLVSTVHSAADIDSHGVKILTDANWDEEIATKPHFVRRFLNHSVCYL